MQSDKLVLGIDGGGSKTVAWLALRDAAGDAGMVGRGVAGGANIQSVGLAAALASLDRAVAAAFDDARIQPLAVSAMVLALAGCDRDENRRALEQWAAQRNLARHFRAVHDGWPVLAAGTPEGWGVALIAGTGSFAFGQAPDGRTARAGGWGYLMGDEGSGYALAVAGLRAAATSADGRGTPTRLLDRFLQHFGLTSAEQLVPAVYGIAADRAAVAALAELVIEVAESQDATAEQIVDSAARELVQLVACVARKLNLVGQGLPLALAGGLLLGSARLQQALAYQLGSHGMPTSSLLAVREPVAGAVVLARRDAAKVELST